MKTTATETNRDGRNGQYAHSDEAICSRCGQRKGIHEAEAPWAIDDACMGEPCEGFKKARKAKVKA